ncbi:MAG TPA: hypothetical protein VF736_07685 [Pyrinomonadaceae bacterium]
MKAVPVLSRLDWKTIFAPSGDQSGAADCHPVSCVSCVWFVPSAFITRMLLW